MTLGVYLVIEEVTEEDFGEYTCRITKPDDRYIDINVTLSEKGKFLYVNNVLLISAVKNVFYTRVAKTLE